MHPHHPLEQATPSGAAVLADDARSPAAQPMDPAPPLAVTAGAVDRGRGPAGPVFDRAQREHPATGGDARAAGARFAAGAGSVRRGRLPGPPMLLADRVTGVAADPARRGAGTISTETDVARDRWYLDPAGRMCPGAVLEAGQGDRLLISRLGGDLCDGDERRYRLLGCDITFHGPLPAPGERLRFDIHIDDQAEFEGMRLFSFRYDARVGDDARLSVRGGQAGLFTDEQLSRTAEMRWAPRRDLAPAPEPVDVPPTAHAPGAFTASQVQAYAEGRAAECFGAGWEVTGAQVRTPRLVTSRGLLFDEVTHFDPRGGPLGLGYLRATLRLTSDAWFFDGHVPDDPYLPGSLMLEGCFQALAFHQTALGLTLDRDGWRFEPLRESRCTASFRGQATPRNGELAYEVLVTAIHLGPRPHVRADVLCSVDGVTSCRVTGLALALVQDWPFDDWRHTRPALRSRSADTRAAVDGGRRLDEQSMLALAWGRYADGLGPQFAALDGPRRSPRLPAPPMLFMTRIRALDAVRGELRGGSWVEAEYDVPDGSGSGGPGGGGAHHLPMAALMEITLQPCGWLAQYSGCCLGRESDLLFRNLDGTTRLFRLNGLVPRRVRTRATLTDWADNGDTILLFFDVECRADDADDTDEPFFAFTTSFGFFPPDAFDGQTGLPPSAADLRRRDEPSDYSADLTTRTGKFFTGPLRLLDSDLLILDRITGYWPPDATGLGRMRGETDVRAGDWFFKAHFFQDPVQPGSLGVEAMYQLLRAYAIERDLAAGLAEPRCETVPGRAPLVWKYRGQVVPSDRRVTVELAITEEGEDLHGRHLEARGWLWVDDTRIYRVDGLALRITPGAAQPPGGHLAAGVFDPAGDTWLADHCPVMTTPCVPMMHVARLVAEAAERATGDTAHQVRDVTVRRWIVVDTPVRYATQVRRDERGVHVELLVDDTSDDPARDPAVWQPCVVASGTVVPGAPEPAAPLPPLLEARPVDRLPYAGDAPRLFHGPAFHYLRGLRAGRAGAAGVLDPRRGTVPADPHHVGLLDGALHTIPNHALWLWDDTLPRDVCAYPYRLDALDLHGPLLGAGPLRAQARLADSDDLPAGSFVRVAVQLHRGRTLLAGIRLTLVLVPLGFLGSVEHEARIAFLRDRAYTAGLGVSRTSEDGSSTVLDAGAVRAADWYPGLLSHMYGLPPAKDTPERPEGLAQMAVRDHVGRLLRAHPSQVETARDLSRAWVAGRGEQVVKVWVRAEGASSVAVGTLAGPPVHPDPAHP